MPAVSLVVCIHKQRDLLARLLREAAGCYDDLVVTHDGLENVDSAQSVERLVTEYRGRFFVRSRAFQQEPHWPFAWTQAKHDWILRLDADEFPSDEIKKWLRNFREAPEPPPEISGYTCIWPLWNGRREISRKYSLGRIFLFHRQRVRFFGMVEQVPVADDVYQSLDLILHHQPPRKSYGLRNLLFRRQAYNWRAWIAKSLLGKPTDLQCWRWNSDAWPAYWEEIRQRPIRTFFSRLIFGTLRTLREQWTIDRRIYPAAAMSGPVHHALICFEYWRLRHTRSSSSSPVATGPNE
jgi:hypothetical protein